MKKSLALLSLILICAGFCAAQVTQNYSGVSATTPVAMTTDGPKPGTTDSGASYTSTDYVATLPNQDTYFVTVAQYPFQVADEDLGRFVSAFAKGTNGTITQSNRRTLSGLPAEAATIESTTDGRTIRFFLLVAYRGNTCYALLFGTFLDAPGTDMNAVATFFSTASIQ